VRTYKRKPGRVNPDRRMARAVELRAEGLSLRQTAERLSCSHQTVPRDLARWEREHANVVPLSHPPVTNSPPGGQFGTTEWDSEPASVVQLRRKA
jgi:DNA invertase Pin-like site-specific DNA recombinase